MRVFRIRRSVPVSDRPKWPENKGKNKEFHVSIALCRAGGFWKLKVLFTDSKQIGTVYCTIYKVYWSESFFNWKFFILSKKNLGMDPDSEKPEAYFESGSMFWIRNTGKELPSTVLTYLREGATPHCDVHVYLKTSTTRLLLNTGLLWSTNFYRYHTTTVILEFFWAGYVTLICNSFGFPCGNNGKSAFKYLLKGHLPFLITLS